ncbi:MAG TPA: hypothetical protein IAC93_02230 [Candidatus Limisoma gallistercoris]|nr:hypothetical protein [Candidatus Limisoma gallistercoris]
MRKYFAFLLFWFAFCLYAEDKEENKIIVYPTQGDHFEEDIPDVGYSDCDNSLSVKFYSESSYSLVVTDEFGNTKCIYNLSTDGEEHSYQMPSLSEGIYNVEISDSGNSYSGEFYVGY